MKFYSLVVVLFVLLAVILVLGPVAAELTAKLADGLNVIAALGM